MLVLSEINRRNLPRRKASIDSENTHVLAFVLAVQLIDRCSSSEAWEYATSSHRPRFHTWS